jgi:hypothetical protein
MEQPKQIQIEQFDIVQIITSRNIKFLSGSGKKPTPHGNWSVIGFIKKDALIAKDNFIVKVPATDLRIIGKYDISKLLGEDSGR